MDDDATTAAVQEYLCGLAGTAPADPVIRALLDRATRRLYHLCASLLHRSYPRLARPPLNLEADDVLGAVVERLLKALGSAKPGNVRQFFALANQHIRWELNDLARHLDERPIAIGLDSHDFPAPVDSDSGFSPDGRRMLDAIARLPDEEREAFELVRIQGLSVAESARILGVAGVTVKRRINRGLRLLSDQLIDLRPDGSDLDSGSSLV